MSDQTSEQVIDIVNDLTQSGKLEVLYKSGLLNSKTKIYRDIYLKYLAYMKQGFTKKDAKEAVASLFKYEDIRTVCRAIATMTMDAED